MCKTNITNILPDANMDVTDEEKISFLLITANFIIKSNDNIVELMPCLGTKMRKGRDTLALLLVITSFAHSCPLFFCNF